MGGEFTGIERLERLRGGALVDGGGKSRDWSKYLAGRAVGGARRVEGERTCAGSGSWMTAPTFVSEPEDDPRIDSWALMVVDWI